MNIIEIIAQDVFDKVRGRFSNLEMGNEEGAVTSNPKEARFFDFDFTIEDKNLGRVSVSINERGSLKIFYSQGITEGVDSVSTGIWYDFLKEMRYFAKRRMLVFDTRDITKGNLNKNDFQYLAQNGSKEDNMNESKMYGTPTRSYKTLENKKKKFKTRMVIRHSEAVDESVPGARSRKIEAIFIENHLGERYKMLVNSLKTAGAMLRHVANGGVPYDNVGKRITEMGTQMAELASFRRHASLHDSMNSEANEILERCNAKFMEIRSTLEGLSKPNYYEAWVENFEPSMEEGFDLDEATLEDYKSKFTVNKFEENLAQYFPLVHKIMQETGTVELEEFVSEGAMDSESIFKQYSQYSKEDLMQEFPNITPKDAQTIVNYSQYAWDFVKSGATKQPEFINAKNQVIQRVQQAMSGGGESKVGFEAFESWADSVVEGTLNPDMLGLLIELLQTGLTFGGNDAFGAIAALENIGMSNHRDWDKLEAALRGAAGANPDGDPKDVIVPWLQKDDPEAAAEIQRMTEPQQAEPAPADPSAAPVEPPVAEGFDPVEQAYYDWSQILQKDGYRNPNVSGADALELVAGDYRGPDGYVSTIRNILTYVKQNRAVLGKAVSDHKTVKDCIIDIKKEYPQFYQAAQQPEGVDEGPADEPVHQDPDADDKRWDDMDESEDSMDNAEIKEPRQASTREIAETVMSFCDKENMTFPKGEEGVIIRCGKMYGPRGEQLAKGLIEHIKQQREAKEAQRSAVMQFEEIRRLAGLVK